MEYTTMPSSRTTESFPTSNLETANVPAENNVDQYESSANVANTASENEPIAHGITPTDVKNMLIHNRKANKAINARKSSKLAERLAQRDSASIPVTPTVTPAVFAHSKYAPKQPTGNTPEAANATVAQEDADEGRRYEIDNSRGFTVTNNRKRSRDELLSTPLDELVASIDKEALTKNRSIDPLSPDRKGTDGTSTAGEKTAPSAPQTDSAEPKQGKHVAKDKPLTSVIDMFYAAQAEADRQAAADASGVPPKPDRDPRIPAMPDHDPTIHLNNSNEKKGLKEALRNPFAYLAGQLDSTRTILRNKREARGPVDERTAKRNKIIKRTLGTVGVVLVGAALWRMGYDAGMADGIGDVAASAGAQSGSGLNEELAQQAAIVAHNEAILNSPVHIIPLGGGGEAYTLANGADANIWYQNQAEFLQLFPNEAHLMHDGNVGFDRPGELSDQAKEYWAKKFGQWR